MERHSQNAARVAEWPSKRAEVARVINPGLQTGEARTDKYLTDGYGGLV